RGVEGRARAARRTRERRRALSSAGSVAADDAGQREHRLRGTADEGGARGGRAFARADEDGGRTWESRVQPRLAHGARSQESADGVGGGRARGDRAEREPRRTLQRRLSGQGSGLRDVQLRDPKGRRWFDAAFTRTDSS